MNIIHHDCIKSIRISLFFLSVFSHIRTESHTYLKKPAAKNIFVGAIVPSICCRIPEITEIETVVIRIISRIQIKRDFFKNLHKGLSSGRTISKFLKILKRIMGQKPRKQGLIYQPRYFPYEAIKYARSNNNHSFCMPVYLIIYLGFCSLNI